MDKVLQVLVGAFFAALSLAAQASSISDSKIRIYRVWVLENLLPVTPVGGDFSLRVLPWINAPELLMVAKSDQVHIFQPKREIYTQLRSLLARYPDPSVQKLTKAMEISEHSFSVEKCPSLVGPLSRLPESYDEKKPETLGVYADGAQLSLGRMDFASNIEEHHVHEEHPAIIVWLDVAKALIECGGSLPGITGVGSN